MKIKHLSFLIIISIFFSCDDNTITSDIRPLDSYGIIFILASYTHLQTGIITKTSEPIVYGGTYNDIKNFENSADVFIDGQEFISLQKDSIINFCRGKRLGHFINYYKYNLNLYPGKKVSLNIKLSNNKIITGSTVLPPQVEFTGIDSSNKYYFIHWRSLDSVMYDWSFRDTAEIMDTKSSFNNYAKLNKKFIKPGYQYELHVYTLDKNLSKYYSTEIERSGIDKGYGLFGSITKTILKVKF